MATQINFIVRDFDDWPEFFLNPQDIPLRELEKRLHSSATVWSARTFWELARRNLPVRADIRASAQLCEDSVNVLHHFDLTSIFGRTRQCHFIVCARGDHWIPHEAHFNIEQNGLRKPTPQRGNIPVWRQHGLIPRNLDRGTRVESIVFKGHIGNLRQDFRSDAFKARLAGMGVNLSLGLDRRGSGDDAWKNYRRADLVLAVRKISRQMARAKPPSKLTNAWAAGVPALLGPEPAFRVMRKSDLDYIEVRSPEEALAAVARLRDDPELYTAMVANGIERAKEFTDDAVAEQWAAILDGPVALMWERWKQRSEFRRTAEHFIGLSLHHASKFHWNLRPMVSRWLASCPKYRPQ